MPPAAAKRPAEQRGEIIRSAGRAGRRSEAGALPAPGAAVTMNGWLPDITPEIASELRGAAAILMGVPLPPSENAIYRNSQPRWGARAARGRHLSAEGRAYKAAFAGWALQHLHSLRLAAQLFAVFPAIEIEAFLGFERSRLFCKDGRVKACDAANYVKILFDCLAAAIGYDDRHFFGVRIVKHPVDAPAREACVIVIKPGSAEIQPPWR